MSFSRITFLQVLLTLGICARLNFNDPLCNKYLAKFGTADNSDGSGASKIAFSGDASFIGATSDVQVNIKYSDVDLFNDPTYFGLVQEDGKTPETTCLDLQIFKFNSDEYQNGELVTDLEIKSSQNFSKQWRYYSFIISGNELNKRLILTQNSNYFIYKGYYGIAFYAAQTDQLQYTFYFQFSVSINRETNAPEETAAVSLSLTATHDCNPTGECSIASQSVLKWCSDFTCNMFTTPDLSLNDSFYLLQIITQEEMKNYYLTQTEVWYTGDGLNKKAKIIQQDNSVKGQIKLQLQADIAWTKVTIQITSVLSDSPNARRRLLSLQTTYDTLLAQNNIECIKDQGSKICSTCDQECKINGFARQGCDFCSSSKLKSLLLLVVLFLLCLI